MNSTVEIIKSRVSCRSYSEKKVPLSKLNQILEAGKYAPSGMNRQICNILAIRSKSKVEKVRKAVSGIRGRLDPLYGANTLCIVYGKKDEPLLIQDGSCILENMFIAAHALGVDSCWINCLKDVLPTPNKKLAKELGLTEEDYIIGTCILGYRKEGEEIASKPRKEDFIRII